MSLLPRECAGVNGTIASANRCSRSSLCIVGSTLLLPLLALGQAADPLTTAEAGSQSLTDIIIGLATQYPVLGSVLLVIGALRFVIKPLLVAARWIVSGTETTADDAWLTRVESSAWLTALLFAIDWLSSIKLPKRASDKTLRLLIAFSLLPAALSLLCGCMSVPTTRINYVPATQTLNIQSPKDVTIESLSVTTDGPDFLIELKNYRSASNVEVVRTVAEANAQMQRDITKRSEAVIGKLIQAAP